MKQLFTLLLSLLATLAARAQPAAAPALPAPVARQRLSGIGPLPSPVAAINGLALGLWPERLTGAPPRRDTLVVRGLALTLFYNLASNLDFQLDESPGGHVPADPNPTWQTRVLGVCASAFVVNGEVQVRGLAVAGGGLLLAEVRGVAVGGLRGYCYRASGLVASFYNQVVRMRGVQVGFYNQANDLRGIQLGVLNVNGRRKLPLLNWQFGPARAK